MASARRLAPIIAVLVLALGATAAVAAMILSPSGETPSDHPQRVAVPEVDRRVPPPSAAPDRCDATVDAPTAAGVERAVDAAGAGVVCFPAGRYEGPFAATVAGQTWRLDREAVLDGAISVEPPDVWITGGTVKLPTADPWAEGVTIDADRATIEGVTFDGGGVVISVKGRDGTQVLDNTFGGQSGTAIFIWGEGRGADDTLIEGNTITQAAARKASPIASRASED